MGIYVVILIIGILKASLGAFKNSYIMFMFGGLLIGIGLGGIF